MGSKGKQPKISVKAVSTAKLAEAASTAKLAEAASTAILAEASHLKIAQALLKSKIPHEFSAEKQFKTAWTLSSDPYCLDPINYIIYMCQVYCF
jgi:hypothetical protein